MQRNQGPLYPKGITALTQDFKNSRVTRKDLQRVGQIIPSWIGTSYGFGRAKDYQWFAILSFATSDRRGDIIRILLPIKTNSVSAVVYTQGQVFQQQMSAIVIKVAACFPGLHR